MGRISLVIADTDRDYLAGIEKCLMQYYSKKFVLRTFSEYSSLLKYAQGNDENGGILILCPDFYSSELPLKRFSSLVVLEGNESTEKVPGLYYIKKYQHVDRFVNSILSIFSGESNTAADISSGRKPGYVTAVYSPAGGSGKTFISTNLSILCSQMGYSVFYLNFEDIAAISCFRDNMSGKSISNVICYLKENEINVGIKIESARSIDCKSGVFFFKPPESAMEIGELSDVEVKKLINHFKATGWYDVVIIDMSTALIQRNKAVLEMADEVIVVLTGDPYSSCKYKAFKKELGTTSEGECILDKARYVINKTMDPLEIAAGSTAYGSNPVVTVGICDTDDGIISGIAKDKGLLTLAEGIAKRSNTTGARQIPTFPD